VALQRKQHHPSSQVLTQSLYELGNAYRLEKQFPEARKCLEEALELCRAAKADNHLQVRILARLARVLRAQGNTLGAAKCYRHVCQMQEEAAGPENPELVSSLMEYGEALELSNKLTEAQKCFIRALNLEKKLGLEEGRLGTLHYRIGSISRTLGEHEQALEAFKAAMSADSRQYGNHHPDVARDLLGMGLIYRDMGDTSRAVGNIMKSLSIYEEDLGKYHPQTIEARNTLEALGDSEIET
ncbi:MAG: tetratricopeptide repeat protein, partial [Candidatus Hydrogenedentes bacterium]|nr:tetratricopeptide repeat protein [Candidatus Hydrogenedentota bacterium]